MGVGTVVIILFKTFMKVSLYMEKAHSSFVPSYKVQCLQTSVNIAYLYFLLPSLLVTDSQRGFLWEGCELPLGSRAGVNCTNTFE